MGSSPGFVSTPGYSGRVSAPRALFRLGFPAAAAVPALTSQPRVTRWFILQKARRRTSPNGYRAPTACRRLVSDSLSLPSPGFFSPFPHGTRTLSVDKSI